MGYYPAMRMVHILSCDDIDDFYSFRLDLSNSNEWKELWEDEDMFGVKFKHTSIDISFYDPDADHTDIDLPYKLDQNNPGIYAVETRRDPFLTIVQMENWVKKHREVLRAFKTIASQRKPALHIEATIV